MSGIVRQFLAERWNWGILRLSASLDQWTPQLGSALKAMVDSLNRSFGKLSESLGILHGAIENGPLPGAYFPVALYCDTPTPEDGIAYTYAPQAAQGLRIISCAASISEQSDASADVEIEIEYQDSLSLAWASILTTTPVTVSVSSPLQLNAAGDFTEPFYSAKAFRVNATDWTNIPKGLMVLLSCKNMGKIEPA